MKIKQFKTLLKMNKEQLTNERMQAENYYNTLSGSITEPIIFKTLNYIWTLNNLLK